MSIKITSGQIIKDVRLLEVDNIKIDNNTISSTNINGDVILEPNGTGNVTVASGNFVLPSNSSIFVGDNLLSLDDTLAEDIKSSYTIGALNAGNTLTSGSNLTTILKTLLQNVFFPTFSNPSGTLIARTTFTPTSPVGASTSKVEIGTSTLVNLQASFSRGSINGKNNASGVWQTGSGNDQNSRSGIAHSYVIDGTNVGSSTSRVTSSNVTIQSTNSWSGTIHHLEGPQPTDSSGANYLSPLPAGSVNISTGTGSSSIVGVRAFFYGALSGSNTAPSTSSDIRNLTSNISWSSPTNGQTLALSVPSGTTMVVFAYPDDYPNNLRNIISVIDSSTGYNVVGVFGQYSAPGVLTSTDPYAISVQGDSGFTAINYKVFVYIPAGAIGESSTYTFTI
jgi:hypothetical protein